MTPEELLHLFGPFLPTDRFRALLRSAELPTTAYGAALFVDVVGFTPLATRLVRENSEKMGSADGPRLASEELRRRLNPMFEVIAGQVFNHGGSVIRFTGDGFLAWFDEHRFGLADHIPATPAIFRAIAAALDMQNYVRLYPTLFRDLRLRVAIGAGIAYRWVVGQQKYGLVDVISGPAVEGMLSAAEWTLPDRVMIHRDARSLLDAEQIDLEETESGHLLINGLPDYVAQAARLQRWPPWQIEGEGQRALAAVRPFMASVLREQVENGFGNFVGELRYALPMFIQLGRIKPRAGDARAALHECVSTIQDVLAETGGQLVSVEVGNKGSVVFAVFGAPITYGDDAERAITAALRLREWSATLDIIDSQQIGVSRGLLYAGIVGGEVRHEYSTIGDETNVASRLMSTASPGQILVTSRVRTQAEPRVLFRELTPLRVKGKDEPIVVSEPIALNTVPHRHVQTTSLVGRTNELTQIQRVLKASAAGLSRILRVEGQAGVGKSRLIGEVARLSIERGFRVVRSGCLSTGRSIAYFSWRELLTDLIDLTPDALTEDRITQLTQAIHQANPDWLVRLPLLGELLQLSIPDTPTTSALEGSARRQALFVLVIDLLFHFAAQQPLTLVIEDIQWIDEVSEALTIEFTRRLSVDLSPLLLVLTHRPLLEAGHTLDTLKMVAELHIQTAITLRELSQSDVARLTERYLDASLPAELVQFVYEKTQGNPLFVQEVLDTLAETGMIRVKNRRTSVVRNLNEADLPPTVQGLIQARIDRLSETDKLVLKVAAVIGTQFQVRVLAESLPIRMGNTELTERLRTLETRDFTYADGIEPELSYLFKHTLIQEVAYQSLLFAQRRLLHQAVGQALEKLYPEAIERLAYHFGLSGDDQRAWRYLLAAAYKADREYANQAALTYLDQALALSASDVDRFQIYGRRLNIWLRIGNMNQTEMELARASALADQSGRTDWRASVQISRANYFVQVSRWSDALNEARSAVALAQALGDELLTWEAYWLLRESYRRLNQRDAARQLIQPMMALVEQLNDPRKAISLRLQELADLYNEQPNMAMGGALSALRQAGSFNDPVLEADCWSTLATFYLRDQDRPAALNAYQQQLGLLRQIGNRRGEAHVLNDIGITLISLGQFSEASAYLEEAYKILRQIGERLGEATSLLYLGVIAGSRRADGEALAYLNRGLVIMRELDARLDVGIALFYIANVHLQKGERRAAENAYQEALLMIEVHRFRALTAEVKTGLAEVALQEGDVAAAYGLIKALLPILEQKPFSDFQQPGLVYWRAVQVLTQADQPEIAERLRNTFREYSRIVLNTLHDPAWQTAYAQNIWVHRALLDADFDPVR